MRLASLVALGLTAASAGAQIPDPYKDPQERAFAHATARAIYRYLPQKNEVFSLSPGRRYEPAMPTGTMGGLQSISCGRSATFRTIGMANELGILSAAECASGVRIADLVARARESVAALRKELPAIDDRALSTPGWRITNERLPDGSTFASFPAIAVGHGILVVFTGVLADPRTGRALVVQAQPYPMCEHFKTYYADSPLCADVETLLKNVAVALREQLK